MFVEEEISMAEDITTDANKLQRLSELIKDIHIAMMTTVDSEGRLHSRPMGYQHPKEGFTGTLYFFTRQSSHKVSELEWDHEVNVSFANPKAQDYVSFAGTARLSYDRTKMDELWNPAYRAWFPDGLDDPDLALIVINPRSIEYWESPNGTAIQVLGFLRAAVSGMRMQAGENVKIDMTHAAVAACRG